MIDYDNKEECEPPNTEFCKRNCKSRKQKKPKKDIDSSSKRKEERSDETSFYSSA